MCNKEQRNSTSCPFSILSSKATVRLEKQSLVVCSPFSVSATLFLDLRAQTVEEGVTRSKELIADGPKVLILVGYFVHLAMYLITYVVDTTSATSRSSQSTVCSRRLLCIRKPTLHAVRHQCIEIDPSTGYTLPRYALTAPSISCSGVQSTMSTSS